jgi:hypothetical protein
VALGDPENTRVNPYERMHTKIAEALNGDTAAAERIMALFHDIHEGVDEADTTTMGDTHERRTWARYVVGTVRFHFDGGTYTGAPRVDGFRYDGAGNLYDRHGRRL